MQETGVLTIGLDVGYGATKGVMPDRPPQIFSSVCGHARSLNFQADEIALRYPGDQLTDAEGQWYIGNLAQSQLTHPGELLHLRGRTADKDVLGNVFRLRMAKAALGKLLPGLSDGNVVHLCLSTGLPVAHMDDAEELKAVLLGKHRIQTDLTDFVANVVEVRVMPQPYGSIFAQTLTEAGEVNEGHSFPRTAVCDVGTYTIDVAVDDDGEYIAAESGSTEAGVYTAQDYLRRVLEKNYRQFIPLSVIDEVLRTGCFRASGQVVDFRVEVQQALEVLRSSTLGLLNDKWKAGTLIDVIYLSGGGAELVHEVVKAAYSQTVLVVNPQIANAVGYLQFALGKAHTPA